MHNARVFGNYHFGKPDFLKNNPETFKKCICANVLFVFEKTKVFFFFGGGGGGGWGGGVFFRS